MRIAIAMQGHPTRANAASLAYAAARLRAYARFGHDVLVVTPVLGSPPISVDGYHLREAPALDGAIESIREFAPDVLACHAPHQYTLPGQVATAMVGRIRTVIWIHGYETLCVPLYGYATPHNRLRAMAFELRRLHRLGKLLDQADAIVYISDWIRNEGQRWTGRSIRPTHVIPNPVDIESFKPGCHADHPKLQAISVRGLERQYGLDWAIEAFAGLDNAELTIVGAGKLLPDYQAMAARLNSPVHFVTPHFSHQELAALFAEFDVFVAPSRTETQGVAMCEAMSCGLPVVANRVGGIPEFVRDGESGILVRKGDLGAIRSALDRLAADRALARRMGMAACRNIRDKCSAESVIPKELEILAG